MGAVTGAGARRESARRASVRAGALTVAGAVGLAVFAISAQNGLPGYLPGVDRTTVRAAFDDTGALRPGDDVRIANVRAGFVDSIDLVDGKPVATLKLDDGGTVHSDARATIGSRSSLGQKYVDLDLGSASAPSLGQDGLIEPARTSEAVELDQLLGTFDPRTRAALGSTLRQVGGGLGGRGDDLHDGLAALPGFLDDLGTVSGALASHDGEDLGTLLRTAEGLASSVRDQSAALARDTRQTARTLDALAVEDGTPLRDTLAAAPEGLRSLRSSLASLDRPLTALRSAGVRMRPYAAALGEATPSLRGLLRESVPAMKQIPKVSGQAATSVGDLTPTVARLQATSRAMVSSFRSLAAIVGTLSPYSAEVMGFFSNAASALSQGDGAGRWLRFYPIPTPETIAGSVPVRLPTTHRQAYPAPGEAARHRTSNLELP